MEFPILKDLVVIFGLSSVVLYLCSRLRIPTIVGFLLTGIVAGPYGLQWIDKIHDVEILAEVGVILLLFTIGIEFSIEHIVRLKKSVLVGGALQVFITTILVFFITDQFDFPIGQSVFAGFILTLSSTAIVLKILQDKAEIASPHGRTSLSILIFQDIIIVPMMLVTPFLADTPDNSISFIFVTLFKGFAVIVLIFLTAQYLLPRLLFLITKTRSKELFMLTVVTLCLGITWLTSSIGLSRGLGAFLAGLVISKSEYSQHALGGMLPFRELFISFFFISVGMLLDLNFFFSYALLIIVFTLLVMFLKSITGTLAAVFAGHPLRTSILVGLTISQIGEFSFVLSRVGLDYGLIADNYYQTFLAVSILSMIFTPFIIELSPQIAKHTIRLPFPKGLKTGIGKRERNHILPDFANKKDHLIIVGYGINGKNLARAAGNSNIPYTIIEMNPETVKSERTKGEPIFYGDASHEAVLDHAGIRKARILVIAIADPAATRRITELAGKLNSSLYIIARTQFVTEMEPLYRLGANEVIPEEYETSIEIFTRVLTKYLVAQDQINRFIQKVRADGYEMFRSLSSPSSSMKDIHLHLSEIEVVTLSVQSNSNLIGQTLAQSEMRKHYGVTLIAIRREGELTVNPSIETIFQERDELILLGKQAQIVELSEAVNGGSKE